MARRGNVLNHPTVGRMVFRKTAGSTGGELLEMEVTYRPNSALPPSHYHPIQEERFEVVKGKMRVQLGAQTQTFAEGETFVVPAGMPHAMHNPTEDESVVIWQVRPALNTEIMFETLWGLAADKKVNAQGMPNLLQAALIGYTYNQEIRQTNPPYSIMRIVLFLLSIVAKSVGYRAAYTRYSPTLQAAHGEVLKAR